MQDGFRSNVRRWWTKLIGDLKPMNWKQRLEYIWMYYKEIFYCVGLVLVAIALLVTILIDQTKQTIVAGMIVNVTVSQEGHNYLAEDYQERLAPGDKNKIVELDYTAFSDMLDPEFGQDSYYAAMILTARVSGGLLDYMILDEFALKYYVTQEVYMDLRDFFTEEELAELAAEDRLIYAMQEEETQRWPIAVDITSIPFAQDNVTSEGKVFFALSGNVQRPEMCRDAWEYLNAWESKEEE